MKRRAFITGVGSAALAPFVARAQQWPLPVVGYLRSSSLADSTHFVNAFRQGLRDAGFIEGENVAIDFRHADNQLDRLPELLAELIGRPVAVIVANTPAALAAKAANTRIPIVFASGGDPVREGLVSSLNRPGGNVTGVSFMSSALASKRLSMLRQLVPTATTIGVLANPSVPNTVVERREVQAAASAIGQQLALIDVASDRDFEPAFTSFIERRVGALLVGTGGFLNSQRNRLVALAARHRLPAGYVWREAALGGGLMSYGPSIADAYREAGRYAARILNGEKPADLPVVQSSKFEFVLNLTTAKALGLDIHPQLLATADEVVE
jgi:putative tryptophan/tyrosine transport system substrate-binding protein